MKPILKKISLNLFLASIHGFYRHFISTHRYKFGFIHPSSKVRFPILIKGIENIFLYENTIILGGAKLLTTKARFVMKKNSSASEGLTVVTGNHPYSVGEPFYIKATKDIQNAHDVIVEEDVVLYTNVTLLAGVTIGRGAVIGSGSVCRTSIPPYAIVLGNPAKIIGFKLFPKQIIEHEKALYPENERIAIEVLQENFNKYFIKRATHIKEFLSL